MLSKWKKNIVDWYEIWCLFEEKYFTFIYRHTNPIKLLDDLTEIGKILKISLRQSHIHRITFADRQRIK